jgi:hypothetical protein
LPPVLKLAAWLAAILRKLEVSEMQSVLNMLAIADRQHSLVCDLFDLDSYFADNPVREWKLRRSNNRRGWTRRDVDCRRIIEMIADSKPHLVPALLSDLSPSDRRVATGFRILKSLNTKDFDVATKEAIAYCESIPRLHFLADALMQFHETHKEWLKWMLRSEPSEVDRIRSDMRRALDVSIRTIHELGMPDFSSEPPRTIPMPIKVVRRLFGVGETKFREMIDNGEHGLRKVDGTRSITMHQYEFDKLQRNNPR